MFDEIDVFNLCANYGMCIMSYQVNLIIPIRNIQLEKSDNITTLYLFVDNELDA